MLLLLLAAAGCPSDGASTLSGRVVISAELAEKLPREKLALRVRLLSGKNEKKVRREEYIAVLCPTKDGHVESEATFLLQDHPCKRGQRFRAELVPATELMEHSPKCGTADLRFFPKNHETSSTAATQMTVFEQPVESGCQIIDSGVVEEISVELTQTEEGSS